MMFDEPVFKVLSRNDTGAAPGHQGGMVIPAALEDYLPDVIGTISPSSPTADRQIRAELFCNGTYKATVSTRYQIQTWGGTRSPERRLTGNLGPIRDIASAGDILLIEKSLEDPLLYRLRLETKSSSIFRQLATLVNGRKWGALRLGSAPSGNSEFLQELASIKAQEVKPFDLFVSDRPESVSLRKRKIRDQAFRARLVELYGGVCAISGRTVVAPPDVRGLDGAHIVPVEAGGSDDPRNGLLLCKDVHWAFDRGLVVVDEHRRIVVPSEVRSIAENSFLRDLEGRTLSTPVPVSLSADQSALTWHYQVSMERISVSV